MSNNIKKIIITDLDGTLLNSKRRVSFKSKLILRKLNRDGYMIVLASGRPWRSIKSVYRQIGCSGPVIAYNGSYVFHPKDKSFPTFLKTFPIENIKKIYSKISYMNKSFMCESLDTVYINKVDKYLKYYFWYKGMKIKKGNINKILNVDPVTCLILRPSDNDKVVDEACNGFGKMQLRHWTDSLYAELYIDGIDKGSAINYLAKQLKVSKKDIIGFGDADNDFASLSACGLAYVMSNSKSENLKQSFNITKYDNDHNGVALTLLEILK